MSAPKKLFLSCLYAAAALCVLSYVYIVLAFYVPSVITEHQPQVPFTEAAWLSAADSEAMPTRLQMLDDLLAGTELAGMTKADLIAKLGPPSDSTHFKSWQLAYPLGDQKYGWFGDTHELWLVFDMDAQGRVTGYGEQEMW